MFHRVGVLLNGNEKPRNESGADEQGNHGLLGKLLPIVSYPKLIFSLLLSTSFSNRSAVNNAGNQTRLLMTLEWGLPGIHILSPLSGIELCRELWSSRI